MLFERKRACNYSAHAFLPILFGVHAGILLITYTMEAPNLNLRQWQLQQMRGSNRIETQFRVAHPPI